MKYLVLILLFSTNCFAQVQETIIRNNTGTVVGRIQTNNNQSMIYDGNGNYLGMVEGDAGLIASSCFNSSVVSGAVVLPSGTQPLDYLLRSYNGFVPNTNGLADAFGDFIEAYPEYFHMWSNYSDKVYYKLRRMKRKGIPEDEVLAEKLRLIEKYLTKQGEDKIIIETALFDATVNYEMNGRL